MYPEPTVATLLAQFWGYTFVVVGAIFLVRRDNIRTLIKSIEDDSMIILTGYLSLMLGIATVIVHPEWNAQWDVTITIIGWIAIIKGVLRLTYPSITQRMIKSYDNPVTIAVSLAIMIIVGGYLLMKGYGL